MMIPNKFKVMLIMVFTSVFAFSLTDIYSYNVATVSIAFVGIILSAILCISVYRSGYTEYLIMYMGLLISALFVLLVHDFAKETIAMEYVFALLAPGIIYATIKSIFYSEKKAPDKNTKLLNAWLSQDTANIKVLKSWLAMRIPFDVKPEDLTIEPLLASKGKEFLRRRAIYELKLVA